MSDTDSSLRDRYDVLAAQAGDRDAFRRLVERYARRVHDLARRMLRDAGEAEDVAQQAFLNAWRALDRFEPDRPFRNWLLRIASNLCRNRLAARGRRRELRPRGGDDPLPEVAAPVPEAGAGSGSGSGFGSGFGSGSGCARSPDAKRLRAAVEALPERYRLPVVLHYVHGLPLAAISEITCVGVATIKTHLHRGRQALRALLDSPETPGAGRGTQE